MKIIVRFILFICLFSLFSFATCKYGFKDISPIPAEVKTFRVQTLQNRAQYVNTQLAPSLTEKLKQKIIGTTRLRQTNNDDAHYDISGYVSQYFTSTVSITGNTSTGNRLTVGFHLIFKNTLDDTKNFEADLVRTYDFDGSKTIADIGSSLTPNIVSDLADEVFNKIFSNW